MPLWSKSLCLCWNISWRSLPSSIWLLSVFSTIRDALSVIALRIRRKYGYGGAQHFLLFNCSFEKSIVYFIPHCFNENLFDPITLLNVLILHLRLWYWAHSHRGNIVESQPCLIRRCPSAFCRENAKKTRDMLQRHTNSSTPAFARKFHCISDRFRWQPDGGQSWLSYHSPYFIALPPFKCHDSPPVNTSLGSDYMATQIVEFDMQREDITYLFDSSASSQSCAWFTELLYSHLWRSYPVSNKNSCGMIRN